jgi:hypothetical protein
MANLSLLFLFFPFPIEMSGLLWLWPGNIRKISAFVPAEASWFIAEPVSYHDNTIQSTGHPADSTPFYLFGHNMPAQKRKENNKLLDEVSGTNTFGVI